MIGPSTKDEKPIYPSFRVELQHLPEAKECKPGDECEIHMKVKMTGLSISRYQNDSEFEIHEIGMVKGKESGKMKDME